MKKICYVTTISSTIESFFIPQLKYLSENGFDVTVICSPDDGLQEELGDKICYIPVDIPRGVTVLGSIHATKNLLKIFKKENFDLIQYSTPNAALYSAIAAKVAKCSIRNYHLMGFRYLGALGIAKIILKSIEKITCKLSTSIECVSKSNLELGVKEKVFQRDKAVVVWNGSTGGVDLNRFNINHKEEWRKAVRNEYNISDDEFVFGFVGRVTKDKGIDELLEAYKTLIDDIDDTRLMIVGDFEAEKNLNQELLVWSKKCDNVVYISSKQDIERYYAAFDVLVLPSYREGFGNVVIEAQAVGVPVMVSNIPGPIDAICEGKGAVSFPVKNSKALLSVMNQMLYSDCETMGKQANEFVSRHFDSEQLVKHILERKQNLF